MNLVILFNALLKRWYLIIGIPVVAAIFAFILTRDLKLKYKSVSRIETGFTTRAAVGIEADNFNIREAEIKFNNLIANLTSRGVIEFVSYNLLINDLGEAPFRKLEHEQQALFDKTGIPKEKIVSILNEKLANVELLSSSVEDERKVLNILKLYGYGYETLKKNLAVGRINYSDYIEIKFFSESPYLSAFVVNAVFNEFMRYNSSQYYKKSNESVEFYENLVGKKKQEVDSISSLLKMYKQNFNMFNSDAVGEAKISQLSSYEQERDNQISKLNEYKLSLKNVNNRLAAYGSNNSPTSNNSKILELKNQITRLNELYIANGSSQPYLLDSIQSLRDELNYEISRSNKTSTNVGGDYGDLMNQKNSLEVQIQIAESNLQYVNGKINNLNSSVSDFATKESVIKALEKEENIAYQEYLDSQDKLNIAVNASLSGGSSIRQVLKGQPSDEPESTNRVLIVGLSFFSSFALCVIVIVLLEIFDESIKTPANFQRITKVKLIGGLNNLKLKLKEYGTITSRNLKKPEVKYLELLRKARFELENSQGKIFLVTSTRNAEGKSSFILSLANVCGVKNKTVLIIDTNFKNNSLSELFQSKTGIEDFANGNKETKPVIIKTDIKNVDFIGCNGGNYTPSEVFNERHFNFLLEQFSGKYDYIFMEGASLNNYTDSKELIKYADKVVCVFGGNSTIKDIDKDALAFLKLQKDKWLGAVLTKLEM